MLKGDISRRLLDTQEVDTGRSLGKTDSKKLNPNAKGNKGTLKDNDFDTMNREVTFFPAMKRLFPHMLFLMNTFSWISCFILANNYKNYGILRLNDDKFLTFVGSVAGIFNGFSRIVKNP